MIGRVESVLIMISQVWSGWVESSNLVMISRAKPKMVMIGQVLIKSIITDRDNKLDMLSRDCIILVMTGQAKSKLVMFGRAM